MKKLLMLAVAAMAFAIPASASAAVFTHNEEVVTETTEFAMTGSAKFTNGVGDGIQCGAIHITADMEANGTGTVTSFNTTTNCATFGASNGFPTHAHPTFIHEEISEGTFGWTIHAEPANNRIRIDDVYIRNTVTHPATPHLVVAENELEGTITATVGEDNVIDTAILSDDGATVNGGDVTVEGTLGVTGGTALGME